MRNRRPALLFKLCALLAIAACLPLFGASTASSSGTQTETPSAKLRGDLAALVAGEQALDSRIPRLVAGYRPGELAYFAVLREPNDAAYRTALEALGARVLRTYGSVNAFALASSPATALRVAALPSVVWLSPVEIVVPLTHEHEVDQSRATTADVGAPSSWDAGVTGSRTRVAVLDTGADTTHPDLDDLDFRHWSNVLNPPKLVEARNFNGGQCSPLGTNDGHGHGTHVSGIAVGTGEGTPLASDDGKYAGAAPGAQLAVGKVITDAGAGLNSDLVAGMEWAAMPADPAGCAIGADIVNMSLGSESRPGRLNSGSDTDFVSYVLDRLAVRYGTLFVAAVGNSGPYIGSALEAPGSAAQALSVSAAAKDWDVNHDNTLSGDTCAGWQHPHSTSASDNDCRAGDGTQPSSISSFSSRGPSGDVWLRPDIAAPGYNIVAAQASTGAAIAGNDINLNTRADLLYATATGTSMAAPATAGSAALVLDAYRQLYGANPSGASGITVVRAPLFPTFCGFGKIFTDLIADFFGSFTLYEVRNGAADPYVGPLAEGAGKLQVGGAIAALRSGLVMYSAASGSGVDAGTGHRDLQGSWQVGAIAAGSSQTQRFVLHPAPAAGPATVSFSFESGQPSDGSKAIPSSWVILPGAATVPQGSDALVSFTLSVPAAASAGTYTGRLVGTSSTGQILRLPVFVSVSLHDSDPAADNVPGPQARFDSAHDVFAKGDTTWPSVVGTSGTGANADWLVFPVDLAGDLSSARFSVKDSDHGDETYDLYLYDSRFDLIASTHPFAAPGVTDPNANDARGSGPQGLSIRTPAPGRHYVAVNRAKVGGTSTGDFGSFVLTLDEIKSAVAAAPTTLAYEGDFVLTQGSPARLAARLTDAGGAPIAGRAVTFSFDQAQACGCTGVTDYRGLAQVATEPITLTPGVHEVRATFGGDQFWLASSASAFTIVVGAGGPPGGGGSGGHVTGGGWFVPEGVAGTKNDVRAHFAFEVKLASGAAPSGDLHYRDPRAGIDVSLVAYTAVAVSDNQAALTGSVWNSDGSTSSFALTVRDVGEPGKGRDTIRFQLLAKGYDRSGTLGGGNIQIHSG
jgi:subtilisin family serine protease